VLDAAERGRAAAFAREADRRSYIAAHAALRRALAAEAGTGPADVVFFREQCPGCGAPHGRPSAAGCPVRFSLSHTEGLAALALAETAVGIDVERLPDPGTVRDTSRALHPREQAELATLSEAARPATFARCWTRKEAYLKGVGTGITDELLSVTYVGTGPRPAPLAGWALTDVPVPAGYAAACAVRDHHPSIPQRRDT
jgi:4'-phosphopantetheinyl transferase